MGSLAILRFAGVKPLRCLLPDPNNSPNIHPSPTGHHLLLLKMPPALGLNPLRWQPDSSAVFLLLLASELSPVCQYSCNEVLQSEATFPSFLVIILGGSVGFGGFFGEKSQCRALVPQLPCSPNTVHWYLFRALSQFSVHLAASYPQQTELIFRVRFGETLYQMLC